jgi:F-type H+-transporting ATPase subunit delta
VAELITNRYATALFEVAKENNAVKNYEEQVKIIYDTLLKNPEFLQVLSDPKIILEEKYSLAEKVFEGKVYDELVGLFILLVRKNRQNYTLDILAQFLEMAQADAGILLATVTTAMPLKKEQLAQIKTNLEKSTKQTIDLVTVVDKDLIGGIVIQVGDKVVDGSVSGQLNTLSNKLKDLRLA